MSYPTIFHLISEASKKSGVTCILIGGFAINYYRVTRHTADVDFLITKEDFEKIAPLLKKEGYKEDRIEKIFARLSNNERYLMDIDFLFVEKDTFDKVMDDAKKVTIAKQEFLVPSLSTLIALKLHSLKNNFKLRENKDLPDIIELIRVNKINHKTKEFKELCLKFATEEIYQKILERS